MRVAGRVGFRLCRVPTRSVMGLPMGGDRGSCLRFVRASKGSVVVPRLAKDLGGFFYGPDKRGIAFSRVRGNLLS